MVEAAAVGAVQEGYERELQIWPAWLLVARSPPEQFPAGPRPQDPVCPGQSGTRRIATRPALPGGRGAGNVQHAALLAGPAGVSAVAGEIADAGGAGALVVRAATV